MRHDGPAPDYIKEEDDVKGTIKWYSSEKGYGFITLDRGGNDVFLHRSHASFDPMKGDKVNFSIAEDRRRKRTYAVEVSLTEVKLA